MIKNTSISPPNERESTFLMADYVEMLCLCGPYNEISLEDALTRVYHTVESEAAREARFEENPNNIESEPEFKDIQCNAAEDWFGHLTYRQGAFKDFYPFELSDNSLRLKSPLSIKAKLYISLLFCSSLRLIEKKFWDSLTSDFELLSAEILKSYLPSFDVFHFGKSQSSRTVFPNKLGDAINQLAHKLNEQPVYDQKDFNDKNTGDGGLDVFAWRPFPDDLKTSATLICLGQCSCSPDQWTKKQYESSFENWRKRINFVHPTANFMFVPFCFRRSDGEWFERDKISSVLVDRLRICSLLNSSNLENFSFFQDVNNFIERYQDSSN